VNNPAIDINDIEDVLAAVRRAGAGRPE